MKLKQKLPCEKFGTPHSPINAPKGAHRPQNAPLWAGSIGKKLSVKAAKKFNFCMLDKMLNLYVLAGYFVRIMVEHIKCVHGLVCSQLSPRSMCLREVLLFASTPVSCTLKH